MFYPMIAFAVTLFLLILFLKTPLVNIALDEPNHRSLHSNVTPRTGGLAIMLALMITWGLTGHVWAWVAMLATLVGISLVDDMRGLQVRWRLGAQLAISALFVAMLMPDAGWWLIVLLTLIVTWITNLYNFMDGSDGLAGGMALFGFGCYAAAAYLGDDLQLAMMCGSVAAASLAFLLFNFHPARIFMGDAGSVPLGFLAGAIGLYGSQRNLWPIWFVVLVFSPFIVDASITLVKRLLHGEKIWQAHRSHYYQRLVRMGFGHRHTALMEYCLMLLTGMSALLLLNQSLHIQSVALIVWLLIYVILAFLIDRKWSMGRVD